MEEARKFKVALTVLLTRDFTILANNEDDAEITLLKKFKEGKIKVSKLKLAGETTAFCIRELGRGRVDFSALDYADVKK